MLYMSLQFYTHLINICLMRMYSLCVAEDIETRLSNLPCKIQTILDDTLLILTRIIVNAIKLLFAQFSQR